MIAPGGPTLTAKSDPCPGVEVYFPTLDAAVDTITVWRTADGVTEAVAGALRATAAGDFVVDDWQVPFGVVSTYSGEVFDINGASLLGAQSAIQVESADVWMQAQVDPSESFIVDLQPGSFTGIGRQRRTQQVFVAGISRPFEQNWGLSAISGMPFNVLTQGDQQAAALVSLLEASPLLIRTPPKFTTIPRLLSASVKQPSQDPLDWNRTTLNWIVWTLTVDEVQPFSKAILRPLITWDDWAAAFPAGSYTWDDVMAVYGAGTWTDAVRNPPNA